MSKKGITVKYCNRAFKASSRLIKWSRLLWRCGGRRSFYSKNIELSSKMATAVETMVALRMAVNKFFDKKK